MDNYIQFYTILYNSYMSIDHQQYMGMNICD